MQQIKFLGVLFLSTILSACVITTSRNISPATVTPTKTTTSIKSMTSRSELTGEFLSTRLTTITNTPTPFKTATATSTPTPTATQVVLPQLSPQLIRDAEWAINYSDLLLLHKGYEHGLNYDSAEYIDVEFPNGNEGVFVTLGFSGAARGYQILYQIIDNRVEMVDLVRSGFDWGIQNIQTGETVGIQKLNLFMGENGRPEQVLKVTGAGHAGTGLWDEGYFEIIRMTDDGLNVIFSGFEASYVFHWPTERGGEGELNQYKFVDLNGNGNKEIIAEMEKCKFKFNDERNEWEKAGCKTSRKTYLFDGNTYVNTGDFF